MRALLAVLAVLLAPSAVLAQSVGDIARRGACSTAGVEGISRQLLETQQCMGGGGFVRFDGHRNIRLTSTRVHPWAQRATRDALHRAADRVRIDVNSAFRTLAEQYVLYHSGGCAAAASPGSSNHQSGRAVDVANWSSVRGTMGSVGCAWLGSWDAVHFDCPGTDRRSDSVRAFQRLWNVNHPGDRIAEDGVYGPATASRLARSPAGGFSSGGCCRAHCDGDVVVGADCTRRRCADGRSCTMEGDGPRCIDDECRATPTGVDRECVADARLRICRDGRAEYRTCEDPNVCRQDRCVDPECPADGTSATLCATDGSLLLCEARRGSRLACGAGDVCESGACVLESCVGVEGSVCLDATTMGECAGGALVSASPCDGGCVADASGARCQPEPCDGAEGAVCLDGSTIGECVGGELVATETCAEGCVVATDVGAACRGTIVETDAGSIEEDAGVAIADAGVPSGDDAGAPHGGSLSGGCSATGRGSSAWWLAALLGLALALRRRRGVR